MWGARAHVILLLQFLAQVWSNGEESFYPNEENCGMTDKIPGDIRTFHPWTVVIYSRKTEKSPYQYFLTGVLTSATTVLSAFGGVYGQPSYNSKGKRYYIAPASNYLIVAGLPTTDSKDADKFTQSATVNYVAPHNANNSLGNPEYHLVLFRLSKPFKLDTPYVRPMCLSFSVEAYVKSIGYNGNISDILTYGTDVDTFMSGFDAPVKAKEPFPSIFVNSTVSTDEICEHAHKYHYGTDPGEKYCSRVASGNNNVLNSTCLTHGSALMWEPSHEYIAFLPALGPDPRYHLSGIVALIPRKDRGQCGLNTTYYVAPMFNRVSWVRRHMSCSQDTFPCNNGQCISLDKVCDEKADCSDGEDEETIFCLATKRCKGEMYQCGLEGKCLGVGKVGDGIPDCPFGNDEDTKVKENSRFKKKSDVVRKDESPCFPLSPSEGVIMTCTHPELGDVDCSKALPRTKATLTCAEFYTPVQRTNYIQMKCYEDQFWKPSRSFICRPECGLTGNKIQSYIVGGAAVVSEDAFPWHAALFRKKRDTYDYICGASLIERNILITAAHCITNEFNKAHDPSTFQVKFLSNLTDSPTGEREKDGHIFEVEKTWHPYSFNARSLRSDIAVVKLVKPVNYKGTIRPICYLLKNSTNFPKEYSTGTVSGYGFTEKGTVSSVLKYVNLNVVPQSECDSQFFDKFCAKSAKAGEGLCYGDSGGGFVFPSEMRSSGSTYVLKGLVSSRKTPRDVTCDTDNNNISEFTHLDSHSEWLLGILEGIDTNPN